MFSHPVQPLPADSHLFPQKQLRASYAAPSGNSTPSTTRRSLLSFQQRQLRRASSQAPSQYAFPLQRAAPVHPREHPSNPSSRTSKADEHVLRRKTPSGTLAAGYDGSIVEWAPRLHPVKHILLPLPDKSSQPQLPVEAASDQGRCRTPVQLNAKWSFDGFGPVYRENMLGFGAPGEKDMRSWATFGQFPRTVDSMLNQSPVLEHSTLYSQNIAQLPALLRPLHQQCLGPTTLNGNGPFGPYWPDGAFIPYRPAALRDPRFGDSPEVARWAGNPTLGGVASQTQPLPQSNGIPSPVDVAMHTPGLWSPSSTLTLPTYDERQFDHHSSSNSGCASASGMKAQNHHLINTYAGRCAQPEALPLSYQASQLGNATGVAPKRSYIERATSGSHPPLVATQPYNQDGSVLAASQLRDHLLTWAYAVYVDLLTSLHQLRAISDRNASAGHSHRRLPKNNIYPRPPRHPSLRYAPSPADAPVTQGATPSHGPPTPIGHHNTPEQQLQADTSLPHLTGTHERYPLQRPSAISTASHVVLQGLGSPTDLSAVARANAVKALETIGAVCVANPWNWIDGMLLAGCLAYGLGDYNEALRWYSNILEIDANHVEATSNLAATLLSLNRRGEAERYWLRAVKLRPSYFEALEHLIGLLCGDQRGMEAVNIIEFVQRSLKSMVPGECFKSPAQFSETGSEASWCSSAGASEAAERAIFDYDVEDRLLTPSNPNGSFASPGFGSSGYAIPATENGRMLALIHAKGNMLYALGDHIGAAEAFEDAVLIGAGRRHQGVRGLIERILSVMAAETLSDGARRPRCNHGPEPLLLPPDRALQTARLLFPHHGDLPGLRHVPTGIAKKAAVSTMSNSLLSLAKIFQDGMPSGVPAGPKSTSGVRDILALYYLSLALQQSPSTANNVGILMASVEQSSATRAPASAGSGQIPAIPGVLPGSGVALALAYYNYGLNLDSRHAHLFTNLGSLLKDIGQLTAAVKMYEQAVSCDENFDIALANLANAVKDQGRISDAIGYYRRAVAANPDFAEAVCGLANALNSVCGWSGRGGNASRERWHVDDKGMLLDATSSGGGGPGWMRRVVDIVQKQLVDGERWGVGSLNDNVLQHLQQQFEILDSGEGRPAQRSQGMVQALRSWAGKGWEGARVVRLVERVIRQLGWKWYRDKYHRKRNLPLAYYSRPQLPAALSVPAAPTVLPFHTFTCPLSPKQIRQISQRNALRISCSTLRAPWLPRTVFCPPAPPDPHLNVGYVSSDFNNHPLAHLMQSVFGFHDPARVKAFCYATTVSDQTNHRQQIEREAPVFYDASAWSAERLVNQIVQDGIHILVNLNGYTRGARNEIFAARPAPIQMSFMGFAGTLGAEWCDYLLADETAVPFETLRPCRRNVDWEDQVRAERECEQEDWIFSENIIFTRDTFFCCDHRQSAPDSQEERLGWEQEQARRWAMRKEIFPDLADDAVIFGNANQLYKIDPGTFRSWLRILARVPKAILWLLRFPELGEHNLKRTAQQWAGSEVASRLVFTDVAPKHMHISRARVVDLFLDTPECNAHTTAADVLWSGTPILTLPRYEYKMCSRMAASILKGALPKTDEGRQAARELIAASEDEYEDFAVRLGNGLEYPAATMEPQPSSSSSSLASSERHGGRGVGRLMQLRKLLHDGRWTSALFDTRRWVRDLEEAYEEAWRRWVKGEGGDIWL